MKMYIIARVKQQYNAAADHDAAHDAGVSGLTCASQPHRRRPFSHSSSSFHLR